MCHNGFEIDMLDVGDADCFVVTKWENGLPTTILIDGGNEGDGKKIESFLKVRGMYCIDHVVCSHPHDDHAGGLVPVIRNEDFSIDHIWIHNPLKHVDIGQVERAISRCRGLDEATRIQRSLDITSSLIAAIRERGMSPEEPFEGKNVGFLKVCGPSEEYYEELLQGFANPDEIRSRDEGYKEEKNNELQLAALYPTMRDKSSDSLLANPVTSPENNSCVIMEGIDNGKKCLFTADAGVQALEKAAEAYDLSNCDWIQIPHHGSRRNITVGLIKYFWPRIAFVSAVGDRKHPRRAIVNAFKQTGAKVYSTHYAAPGGNKWHHSGNVPDRPDYKKAVPLYEAGE